MFEGFVKEARYEASGSAGSRVDKIVGISSKIRGR
jgi:hypothetical protein